METRLAQTDIQGLAPVSRANDYIADSVAANTRRGYASDFRLFSEWCSSVGCQPLPADPAAVAAYFSVLADGGKKASTIDRARAAIRMAHETAGLDDPTSNKEVKLTLKGIRHTLGTAQAKKSPILAVDMKSMVNTCPASLIGFRDRALLLLGFAGGFRRSELASITLENLTFTSEGVRVFLPFSKTDQEGHGRVIGIKLGNGTCPVRALKVWIDAAGITSGPIFRRIDRHGHMFEAITAQTVALVVKRTAKAAGFDPAEYSGHSLRAGLVTQAAINGASVTNIMRQTGHKSSDTVRGYVRIANIFQDNISGIVGL